MSEDTTTDTTVTDETVVETAPETVETATTADTAAPEAPKAKGKKGKAAAAEADPTVEEAEAMFKDRPGLDSVRTQAGWLTRDGQLTVLTPALAGE